MSSPKDDGAPRFLKKILGDSKKKKRKIVESDEEDGFTNNASFGDSDDEEPVARKAKKTKADVPKKSSIPRRKSAELSVPKKDIPKKNKDKEEVKKGKGSSSLLSNMEAPPPAPPPSLVKGLGVPSKETTPASFMRNKETTPAGPSSSSRQPKPLQPDGNVVDMTSPKRGDRGGGPGRSNAPINKPPQQDSNHHKLEAAFPTVSSPANPVLVQNLVVSNKPMPTKKNMTPKGRMMMSTLEKMCTKLNDHTHFQLLLRGNLPTTTSIDLSGSFSCDESQAYDFFNYTKNGDIIVPTKIAIFPEDFPPGFKEHSLHWWGIVDPAVGARKDRTTGTTTTSSSSAPVVPAVQQQQPKRDDRPRRSPGRRSPGRDEPRRRSPGRGGGYHGGPPPPGWGGGGGQWEQQEGGYGRWEGGGGGRYHGGPPPPGWGGGGGDYWDGRRGGDGPPHHRGGGEPHHHHRGPPPDSRGRGPMDRRGPPMDGRGPPMDGRGPPMDRPPMDRPPMDRDRRGPPPQNFPPSGGRGGGGGRRDRM